MHTILSKIPAHALMIQILRLFHLLHLTIRCLRRCFRMIFRISPLAISLFVATLTGQVSADAPVPGHYTGTCYSQKLKSTADLELFLEPPTGNSWNGMIVIYTPLARIGKSHCEVQTIVEEDRTSQVFRIETNPSPVSGEITWLGVVNGEEIHGKFFDRKLGDEGTFQIRLKDSAEFQKSNTEGNFSLNFNDSNGVNYKIPEIVINVTEPSSSRSERSEQTLLSQKPGWIEKLKSAATDAKKGTLEAMDAAGTWLENPRNQQFLMEAGKFIFDLYQGSQGGSGGVNVPANQSAPVWVQPYYRSDGVPVQGHYRSAPDGSIENNYGGR